MLDADGWRPIDETAKNGENWLLGSDNGLAVCFWDEGWQTADGIKYRPNFFTYYQALPPAPREAAR